MNETQSVDNMKSYGLAEPQTKSAPVLNEAVTQAGLVEDLAGAIGRLETALAPVLGMELPPMETESRPTRGESKLYNILDGNNISITTLTRYVNQLTARVEL